MFKMLPILKYPLVGGILLACCLAIFNVEAREQKTIEVAPGHKGNTQISQSANGVPVVDIANPNSAGVSHNKFQQFNVENRGVVLNNSKHDGISQLGGAVFGNRNLQENASTIINEVVSTHPSNIMGPTEVHGPAADYILANPNGIYVNGGEFININNAVLTTGRVHLDEQGKIQQFIVDGGKVQFEGRDVNLNGLDHFDIISNCVRLNAAIHNSKKAQIVAGKNTYNYKTKKVESTKQGRGEIAIDSSALGGLYAGKITIISNAKGVGVNLPDMASTAGEISISASGDVEYKNVRSATDLDITSGEGKVRLHKNKANYAKGDTKISAGKEVRLGRGSIIDSNKVKLSASNGNINNLGTIRSGSEAGIGIDSKNLLNEGSLLAPAGKIESEQSGDLVNKGKILASSILELKAKEVKNKEGGSLYAGQDITFSAKELTNQGAITSQDNILLKATEGLNNEGNIRAACINIEVQDGHLNNLGNIFATTDLNIITAKELLNEGKIISDHEIIAKAETSDFAKYYRLMQEEAPDAAAENTAQGAGPAPYLAANAKLESQDDSIVNKGLIYASGNLNIKSQTGLKNDAGRIASNKDLKITTDAGDIIFSDGGNIEAKGSIIGIAGGAIVNEGSIWGASNIALENSGHFTNLGKIQAEEGLSIASHQALNNGGLISANNQFAINAEGNISNSGKLISTQDNLIIGSANDIENSGLIWAKKDVTIGSTGGAIVNSGKLVAARDISLKAVSNIDNLAGAVLQADSGAAIKVTNGGLRNAGQLISNDDISFKVEGNLDNDAGHIEAGGNLAFEVSGDVQNQGGGIILAHNELKITLGGGLQNAANANIGTRAGDIIIDSAQEVENAGQILTGKKMSISSGANMQNDGLLKSSQQLALKISGDILNKGEISADGALSVESNSVVGKAEAVIVAGGDLTIEVQRNIDNAGKLISTNGMLSLISQDDIDNKSVIWAKGDLSISTASGAIINVGKIASLSDAALKASKIFVNQTEAELFAQNIAITAEEGIENNHLIYAENQLDLQVRAGGMANSGEIFASSGANIETLDSIINRNGKLISHADLVIKSQNGEIVSKEAIFSASGDMLLLSQGGISIGPNSQLAARNIELSSANDINLISPATKIISRGSAKLNSDKDIIIDRAILEGHEGLSLVAHNKITNNDGKILSDADLLIESIDVVSSGHLQATSKAKINAENAFENAGKIVANKVEVKAGESLSNIGAIEGQDLELALARGLLKNAGSLKANHLSLKLTDGLQNESSGKISATSLNITPITRLDNRGEIAVRGNFAITEVRDFVNSGQVASGHLNIANMGQFRNKSAGAISGGAVTIAADDFKNLGTIKLSGNASVRADDISNSGTMEAGSGNYTAKGVFDNNGQINIGTLSIETGEFSNNRNAKIKSNRLKLDAGRVRNGGTIFARDDLGVKVTGDFNNHGSIVANNGLKLDSVNRRSVANSGLIYAVGNMELLAGGVSNSGEINSVSNISLAASSVNNSGRIVGKNGVSLSGTLSNGGIIASDSTVRIAAGSGKVTNYGTISAGGHIYIDSQNLANNRLIEAKGALTLNQGSGGVVNAGSLYGGSININSQGDIENTARIIAKGALSVASSKDIINKSGGEISAIGNGDLSLRAANIINNRQYEGQAVDEASPVGGTPLQEEKVATGNPTWDFRGESHSHTITRKIHYRDTLTEIDKIAPKIYSNNSILLRAEGDIANVAGVIYARNDIDLIADSLKNHSIPYQNRWFCKRYNHILVDNWRHSGTFGQGPKSFIGYSSERDEFVGEYWERAPINDDKTPYTTSLLHAGGRLRTEIKGEVSLSIASEEEKKDSGDVKVSSVPDRASAGLASKPKTNVAAASAPGQSEIPGQAKADFSGDGPQVDATGADIMNEGAASFYQRQYGGADSNMANASMRQDDLASMAADLASTYQQAEDENGANVLPASFSSQNFNDPEINAALAGAKWYKPSTPNKYWIKESSELFTDFEKYFSTDSFIRRIPGYDPRKEFTHYGDPMKQMRLLQNQMAVLTGMMSIDDKLSAAEQMRKLYQGAENAAEQMQLTAGISLTQEQVAALQEDMVWPELVQIDGKEVLVPKLYLAKSKVRERASGILASKMEIKAGAIKNNKQRIIGREVSLDTSTGGILNEGGQIFAEEYLQMTSLGNIVNMSGGQIKSKGSALMSAENIINLTDAKTYGNDNSSFTVVGADSVIDVDGMLQLNSKSDIMNVGADIRAGELRYKTGGDFTNKSLTVSSHSSIDFQEGHMQRLKVSHKAANVTVKGDATGDVGGDFTLLGSKMKVGGDSALNVGGDVLVKSQVDKDIYSSSYQKKSRDAIGAVEKINTSEGHNYESLAEAGIEVGGKNTISSKGNQQYVAARIKAGDGTVLSGDNIKIRAIKLKNSDYQNSFTRNAVWQEMKDFSKKEEDLKTSDFAGKLEFAEGSKVEIEYLQKAKFSSENQDDKFEVTIDGLPKPAWMQALEGQGNVSFVGLETESKQVHKHVEGLTPEGAAIVTLVATAATGGAAAADGGLTMGNLLAVAGNSMLGTAAGIGSVSAINNKFDIGKVAQDLTSKKNLRQIAQSGAIAALTFGVSEVTGLGRVGGDMNLMQRFQGMAEKGVIKASVNSLVRDENLLKNLQGEAPGVILGMGQSLVGDIAGKHNFSDGSAVKTSLHSLAGGTYSWATGSGFASGAVGGAVSELMAPATVLDEQSPYTGAVAATAMMLAGGKVEAINAASSVAESAVANNRRLHSSELDILQKLQKGKSPEEQQRLRDAAMHMIKGEAGVNKYDPRYQEIKASSDRGAGYTAEQQMLRTASEGTKAKWTSAKIKEAPYFRVGLDLPQPYPGRVFDYDIGDGAFDFASRNDEIPNRLGGAAQTLGGAVGTVGGVVGGVFTAETGVGAAVGGGVAGVSAVVALDGAKRAFGPYKYTEGGKVLDSFDKPTPSYAADFGANIAIDTTAAIGLAAAGKALPKVMNGLLRGGTGKTGPPDGFIPKPIHNQPKVKGENSPNTLKLKVKNRSTENAFKQKVSQMQDLAKKGKLRKTDNLTKRSSLTAKRRREINKNIDKQWGEKNPEFARKAKAKLKGKMDVDHVHEIQLDGPDELKNLQILNRSANRSIGAQIRHQLEKIPQGTKIEKVEIIKPVK